MNSTYQSTSGLSTRTTQPGPHLGHVHLRVSNLERSIRFYERHLGFVVVERAGPYAFLSGSSAHHELALQEIGVTQPQSGQAPGLFHSAYEVPDEATFLHAVRRLRADEIPFSAVDYGISWALYFSDPDYLGVEIFLDRRQHPAGRSRWNGRAHPLDLPALIDRFNQGESLRDSSTTPTSTQDT